MIEKITPEALAEWLKTKNPKIWYNDLDPYNCVFGRFSRELGIQYPISLNKSWERHVAFPQPHTYGAALERVNEILERKTNANSKE